MSHLLGQLNETKTPSLMCTITSPPYGAMKNYDHPDQIGFGQPYDEYLVEMRRVFRLLHQSTMAEGSMWVIADTLRSDSPRGGGEVARLEPLPFQLADQAADAGWVLREVVIWQKHKTLPWSSGRRLRNVFEYVLLFAKSADYKFRSDRIRETETLEDWWVKWPERYNPNGKVPTNVWDIPIPVQGSWRAPAVQHACPLPPDLIERLVLLSTDPGDIVFDPFAGTGVVVAEAQRLGRRGLGIELNKKYVAAFSKAVLPEVLKRDAPEDADQRAERAQGLRQDIMRLRAIKYPKVLFQELSKDKTATMPRLLVAQMTPPKADTLTDPSKPISVKTLFVYGDDAAVDLADVTRRLKEIAGRAPATKYGVAGETIACSMSELSLHMKRGSKQYLYDGGRTWTAVRTVKPAEFATLNGVRVRTGQYPYPPIVANVEVQADPGLT
jgi:DNA modification methylase